MRARIHQYCVFCSLKWRIFYVRHSACCTLVAEDRRTWTADIVTQDFNCTQFVGRNDFIVVCSRLFGWPPMNHLKLHIKRSTPARCVSVSVPIGERDHSQIMRSDSRNVIVIGPDPELCNAAASTSTLY